MSRSSSSDLPVRCVGIVGLGKMGLPIARRLRNGGFHVLGFDPAPSAAEAARAVGVRVYPSAPEVFRSAELVFTSLPNDDALIGLAGSLTADEGGGLLADLSTIGVEASRHVALQLQGCGVGYLRAPVSGNPVVAAAGELTMMLSGPAERIAAAEAACATFTRARFNLGEGEQARYAKLAINLMIAVTGGMMAEAMALARAGGLDPGAFLDVMSESAVGSPMVKYKAGPLKARDFSPTFTTRQQVRDMDLILKATRAHGVVTPLAVQVRESLAAMIDLGWGDEDFIATVKLTEHLSA